MKIQNIGYIRYFHKIIKMKLIMKLMAELKKLKIVMNWSTIKMVVNFKGKKMQVANLMGMVYFGMQMVIPTKANLKKGNSVELEYITFLKVQNITVNS